jgi:hypothetical protein
MRSALQPCGAGLHRRAALQGFGASWKKVLHNDLEVLGLTQAEYDTVLEKLAVFDAHINHIEGVDIKFGYK